MYVEYNSNNSGGDWWLTDDDWKNLEKAGWKIVWKNLTWTDSYEKDEDGTPKLIKSKKDNLMCDKDENGEYRFLGALATTAYKANMSLKAAADEWESITGKSATDAGCACCGQPHNFTEYDDNGDYVTSGPDTDYSCSW